ncbi:MAG: hypothetical protein IJH95_04530 [Mogibacterium sp.]|nr:hypothetical protein [Mogibacterium sp.]
MNKKEKLESDEAEIRADIRLRFARSGPYFGKGTMMLLREIQKSGNVRKACENCGFSYSKGWTILEKCEKGLGYKVVDRRQGGSGGGIAEVNETGKKLMRIFDELNRELSDFADRRFRELMDENGLNKDE